MNRLLFLHVAACLACTSLASPPGATVPPTPFTQKELTQFLSDGRVFLSWVKDNREEALVEDVAADPERIGTHTNALAVIRARGWDPPRFCYVLNHILVGYQALGAGWNPERLIDRIEKTKERIRATNKLSEFEKLQTLQQMDSSIESIKTTQRRFRDIPESEVRLMLKARSRLEETFRDVMPIAPVPMPNI